LSATRFSRIQAASSMAMIPLGRSPEKPNSHLRSTVPCFCETHQASQEASQGSPCEVSGSPSPGNQSTKRPSGTKPETEVGLGAGLTRTARHGRGSILPVRPSAERPLAKLCQMRRMRKNLGKRIATALPLPRVTDRALQSCGDGSQAGSQFLNAIARSSCPVRCAPYRRRTSTSGTA